MIIITPSHLGKSALEPETDLLQLGEGLAAIYLAIVYANSQWSAECLSRFASFDHRTSSSITHRRELRAVFSVQV
jgi:hypothetical protein